jgi:cytoskeletal protein CcmA (bactofilin family)
MALFNPGNSDASAQNRTNRPAANTPNQINMIGEGTVLEGTVRADGDLNINGKVVGKVLVKGKVVVAQSGVIEGEMAATSADLGGTFDGTATVEERLTLRSNARVTGTLNVARLVIEEGAVFDGDVTMGKRTVSSGKLDPLPSRPDTSKPDAKSEAA